MAPIHDHMTTFLLPEDDAEYLEPAERPPVHLLRVLPAEQMEAILVETTPISNRQVRAEWILQADPHGSAHWPAAIWVMAHAKKFVANTADYAVFADSADP